MDANSGDLRLRNASGKNSPEGSQDRGRGAALAGGGTGSGRVSAEKVKDLQLPPARAAGDRRTLSDSGKDSQPEKPGHERMPSRAEENSREKNGRPNDGSLSRRSGSIASSSNKSVSGVSTRGSGGDVAGSSVKKNRQDGWYFSKDYLLKHSPSRADGIDSRRETYLRRSYCTFLQDLGMRLKV